MSYTDASSAPSLPQSPCVPDPRGSVLRSLFSGRSCHYRHKEHLFLEGDSCAGVFLITSGRVIVYTVTLNGQRQVQSFAGPGDLLGLNFSGLHTTSAEALGDVVADMMPRCVFDRVLQTSDGFRKAIFERIDQMMEAARNQNTLLGCKGALEKTATFLMDLDARFSNGGPSYVPIPMSRSDIADFLGLTLETVSRMLSRLKSQNVIDLPKANCFRILDRRGLSRIAGVEAERIRKCPL